MATSERPFRVTIPPNTESEEANAVAVWAHDAFESLAADQDDKIALELRPRGRLPDRPREGMIIYANSVLDPGGGVSRPYYFDGTLWKALGRKGDTSGTVAPAGDIGEIIEKVVPYAGITIASGAITNVGSMTVTPGRWVITISGGFVPQAATITQGAIAGISTASGVLQNTPVSRLQFLPIPATGFLGGGIFNGLGFNVGPTPLNVSVNTTVFFIGFSVHSGGTSAVFGHMQALRTS